MTLPFVTHTASAEETEALGAALAHAMLADPTLPPFVALFGDLGVGKTALIRGFASVIAPAARVKSPTFALVHEYRGTERSLFHFDMYRITGEDDLYSIGFYDYLDTPGICLVEWSENIPDSLPRCHLRIEIVKDDPARTDSRRITVSPIGF